MELGVLVFYVTVIVSGVLAVAATCLAVIWAVPSTIPGRPLMALKNLINQSRKSHSYVIHSFGLRYMIKDPTA